MISMRSSLHLAAVSAAALLLACTGTTTGLEDPKPWELRGAYDLARVVLNPEDPKATKDLIFVLSSERNQLHVLDVTLDTKREYVRAPNPIEPLAIPVLRQPMRLIADTTWRFERLGTDDEFYDVGGPLVYAHNPASPDVSIIDAREANLREMKRLSTTLPVTAITARGRLDGRSTLYVALRDEAGAALYAVDIPPGAAGTPDFANLELPAAPLFTVPGETISALLTLPPLHAASTDETIVVATRGTGAAGTTFLYDRTTGARTTLAFPAPVRLLQTHGATRTLRAGRRIFGVLDETSCGGADVCRGIVGVGRGDGAVLLDSTGQPMLPIVHGDALPVSMILVPNGDLGQDVVLQGSLDLMGLVSYSTGELGVFDGVGLRFVDGDLSPPYAGANAARAATAANANDPVDPNAIQFVAADGGVLATSAETGGSLQLNTVQIGAEGVVRTETMVVAFEGRVPGLDRLPLDPNAAVPTTYAFDPAFTAPCPAVTPTFPDPDPERCVRVRPGDEVELAGACTARLDVLTVGAGTLTTSAPPATCLSASSWTVRARGARPFVVSGDQTGFMGRAAPNGNFRYFGRRYYRPKDANLNEAAVDFILGANPPGLARDDRYVMPLYGGVAPLWFSFRFGTDLFDTNPFPAAMVYRCSDNQNGNPNATIREPQERVFPCESPTVRRLYVSFPASLPDNRNENVGWLGEFEALEMFENSLSVPGEFFP